MDTIFAVSSGAPPAAIAVLRLSGPGAFAAVEALAGDLPDPRRATLRALREPASGALLDRALLLCFPGPGSATGEDLAELHLHGGRAVVRAVEAALAAMAGLRAAEPGEFTRRALLNGRLDLSEAEGLGDLLMAETEAQRRVAIRSAEGAVRRAVEGWTMRVLGIAASVEAMLDHSDEDDVASGVDISQAQSAAAALAQEIDELAGRPPVERLRDGLRVVLAGPPNAGKSTLFNALTQRDAAIVSPIAGTTRDRIEAPIIRDGVAYLLIDTAGLNERPGDAIEAVGVERARDALAQADILLWLDDRPPPEFPVSLWIHARADAPGRGRSETGALAVSAETGRGSTRCGIGFRAGAGVVAPTGLDRPQCRQRSLCMIAVDALGAAASQCDMLLVAEELRRARGAFDAISGRSGVEAMLDALFARFCIGK